MANLIDVDGNGRIDEQEVEQLLIMLKLSAVTAIADEPSAGTGSFPSVGELLEGGEKAGHGPILRPILHLLEPLEGQGLLRLRTTKGSLAWETQRRDARWAPVVYLSPAWKRYGAVLSFFVPTMEDLHPEGGTWEEVRSTLESRPGSFVRKGGNMLRVPLDSEGFAREVAGMLSALHPFAAGSPG